ncbi:hypothetical protein OJ253_1593 [Cryptosporidium canis]|uniref:OB-fold nucleic acid binding domain-containing protein n=1 Tax=Cryptosporidium canis TaxID=195482 RepID=A0A9D5DM71_9CRYT|nr:hypothetical protein OJ253_1593 [Cryptosporidium canis]
MNKITTPDQNRSLNSPNLNHNFINSIEFEQCYIKEISSKFVNKKKYVKLIGIIIKFRKKPKYLELISGFILLIMNMLTHIVDDSSDILRAIFWGSRSEFHELNLFRNLYTNQIDLGTLVEVRGTIEFYNSKSQLKLFYMSYIYNYNVESLWWFRIFEKLKKKNQKNISCTTNIEAYDGMHTLASSICKMRNYSSTERVGQVYFNCICKNSEKKTNAISILNSCEYRIVRRIVITYFNRFMRLNYAYGTNLPNGEDVHFLINKVLISDQYASKILKELRDVCVSCTLKTIIDMLIKDFDCEVRFINIK